MDEITVKTVKGFDNGGTFVQPGSSITVTTTRAGDLLGNGLIEDFKVKSAETSENKKAPEPSNKAAPKPKAEPAKPKAE
jgi:hypothetical protein